MVNPEAYSNLLTALSQLNLLGGFVYEGISQLDQTLRVASPTVIIILWEKIRPVALEWRRIYSDPFIGFYAEYLYGQTKKRFPNVDVHRYLNIL